MLKITKISGNIFDDDELQKRFEILDKQGKCERLQVSRQELEKTRLRKSTDKGTDVGLLFNDSTKLNHGDVLISEGKFILVEQIPEKVISIKIKQNSNQTELLVLLGHIIGNRHRPIAIDKQTILFPIQADSELDLFKSLFSEIIKHLEMKVEERVFVPRKGMDVHEH
ncbi:MAG: Urease accessory protein [Nitrosopumilales archaeon]|nr:Urease accessory protein [Nitrosopumilales archaeon]